ncbi:hypothetical protein CBL_20094 [Carabus blaptoides fortunei]
MRPTRVQRQLYTKHDALKDKPKEFFQAQVQHLKRMKLDNTDIFEALQILNLKLQGNVSANIITHHDAIQTLVEKLLLWKRRLQAEASNFSSFPKFASLMDTEVNRYIVANEGITKDIISHLESLIDEFQRYFPNLYNNEGYKFARNPFNFDINTLPEHMQEQVIDLKHDSASKGDFENLEITSF